MCGKEPIQDGRVCSVSRKAISETGRAEEVVKGDRGVVVCGEAAGGVGCRGV